MNVSDYSWDCTICGRRFWNYSNEELIEHLVMHIKMIIEAIKNYE